MKGPRFKQCRRLNLNVFGHPKAMNRAGNGQARDDKKLSNYGSQLLEKQRLRGYYQVKEKQFRNYVKEAIKAQEQTGHALVKRLECRLDNLVYRSGLASSIRQARQMVVHRHVLVNGKRVDIPSYKVNVGDTLSLKEKYHHHHMIGQNFAENVSAVPPYLTIHPENYSVSLDRLPILDEVPIIIDLNKIVEFYSR